MKTSYTERDYAFGQVMLTLRNKIGMTQEQLGVTIGVSGRAVSEWETGNSYPKAGRLKVLIALAVQHQAFTSGHETEEIRALWKVARQRVLLDEHWLSTLLSEQAHALDIAPPSVTETTHHTPAATPPPTETKENCNDAPAVPFLHKHEDAKAPKTTRRHKWLLRILIALVILTIIGSIGGTLFFQARESTSAYLSGKGTLAFFDPLREASGSKWMVWSKPGWSKPGSTGGPCEFIGGTYHAIVGKDGAITECPASAAFSNFVFEVRLAIVQGDCGGMFFRDVGRHTYYFSICLNGLYNVFDRTHKLFGSPDALDQSNYNSAIHTGLGQQNTIAVEASGSRMIFYVNSQRIDEEQDRDPTSGGIGFIADPHYHSPTDVAFSNARVWTL